VAAQLVASRAVLSSTDLVSRETMTATDVAVYFAGWAALSDAFSY
jgi:hypothetical protein